MDLETKRKYRCFVLLAALAYWLPIVATASELQDQAPGFWLSDFEEGAGQAKEKVGMASWYGGRFHGRKTASGERYNKYDHTCASRYLPFGTVLQVTHLHNGKTALVRVNDRGPFLKNRILDLSYAVAKQLGILKKGVGKVSYSVISRP